MMPIPATRRGWPEVKYLFEIAEYPAITKLGASRLYLRTVLAVALVFSAVIVNTLPAEERPFVFVVEDNSGDELMTLRSLRDIAKTTEVARDGAEALDRLRRLCEAGRIPDVVLLDLKLPLMNGFEVLEAIQADGLMPEAPVIVLSSSDLESDHERAEELGVREFVSKPVSYQSYIETVRRAVNEALLTN